MLKQAQADQNQGEFLDNMLRAGTTVGHAIAGTKADYSGIDALHKQNARGVENVKGLMDADMASQKIKGEKANLKDDELLRDPNSDMSKTLRGMLSELGYPVNDKVSGKQLKDMGINVYNLIAQKEAREAARLNRDAMMTNSNTERTKSAVDRNIQNLRQGKAYIAYNNTKDAIAAFDYALATGDKEAVGTAFMKFAKSAQGDDSVVRSEDMKTLAGSMSMRPDKVIAHYAAKAQGKSFTKTEMQNMKKIMEAALKAKGQSIYKQSTPILKKIENAGLDANEHLDPAEVEEFSKYAPVEQAPAGKVRVSNGQETLEIDAADLADAEKDGYKRVQ